MNPREAWEVADLLAGNPEVESEIASVTGSVEATEQLEPGELAQIAVTVLVRDYLRAALKASEHRDYWRYTLACAIACGELSHSRDVNPVLAYAGGLLHDIGRLALIVA